MIKTVSTERTVEAPADLVYARLAAVDRHQEWDETVSRTEPITEDNTTGAGAEWKVYEHFSLLHATTGDDRSKQATGLSKRTLKELVPNERVSWTTHMMPNLGVSATVTWTLHEEGRFTRALVDVSISVPMVVEKMGRVMFRNLDTKYEAQLNKAIDALKTVSEAELAKLVVAV